MRRSGFTIIEMLVVMTLMLLVLGIAWQLLLPGLRIWTQNQAQASLEETGLVMETRFVRDIEKSTQLSVSRLANNGTEGKLQAIGFASTGEEASADSYDPSSGEPTWQYYVVYFIPSGSHDLYRKIWPVPWLGPGAQTPPSTETGHLPQPGQLGYSFPNTIPVALTDPDLTILCQTHNGTEKSIGTCVSTLKLDFAPGVNSNGILILNLLAGFTVRGNLATSHRQQEFHFWM